MSVQVRPDRRAHVDDMLESGTDGECLDLKQLFFNNLHLMGFDAQAMEATAHIPFNSAMFNLPNKRGAEIVLHFLFQRLNPTMCKEAFRDCWPVHNKECEQEFRKACSSWLTNISKEEPDSCLPRINASLFMSPGGQKFYQLLFYFSTYVLNKVMERELGNKALDSLKHPTVTSQNVQLGAAMGKVGVCSSIQHRKNYFNMSQLLLKVNRTWKESADELVKEHRKLSKELRDIDYSIRQEEQRSVEASLMRGSPGKKRGFGDELDPNFDPRTIKRAQRIQQVRDMWKQLEDFDRSEAAEREVVESIVERTVNKYQLDAADISVKVPDMLLRECGDEIRRRNIENTYQGGKLNIVSVLQLWNLALKLYAEKFKQVGLPKLDGEVQKLTSQLHMQQVYQQNASTLRQQMADHIPNLKASVEQLQDQLDQEFFPEDPSLDTLRKTSVGLDLMGPSPKPSFSPASPKSSAEKIKVPRLSDSEDTPRAMTRIQGEMKAKASVRRGPTELFDGDIPVAGDNKDSARESSIPQPTKSQSQASSRSRQSSRHSSRPTSARSVASSKGSKKSSQSLPKVVRAEHAQFEHKDGESGFAYAASPRTMMQSLNMEPSIAERNLSTNWDADVQPTDRMNLSATSQQSSSSRKTDLSVTLSARSDKSSSTLKSASSRGTTPRSEKSSASTSKAFASPRSARSEISRTGSGFRPGVESSVGGRADYVAGDSIADRSVQNGTQGRRSISDLIVDEIMGEREILSPFNSGMEAFESHDMIRRTPDLDMSEDKENITPVDITTHTSVMSSARGAEIPGMDVAPMRDVDVDFDPDTLSKEAWKLARDDLEEGGLTEEAWNLVRGDLDKDKFDELDVDKFSDQRKDRFDDQKDKFIEESWTAGNEGIVDPDKDTMVGKSSWITGDIGGADVRELITDELPPDGLEACDAEFEDILGPELEEEYDNDTDCSLRSSEKVIVIDHCASPKAEGKYSAQGYTHEFQPSARHGIVVDERKSSLEHSPREIIVIDKSFQHSPKHTGSPRVLTGAQLNLSYPGIASPDGVRLTRDQLSQSLVHDSSPLKDEIRKMFKDALADTPPGSGRPVHHGAMPPVVPGSQDKDRTNLITGMRQQSSELELPNMDLDSREADSDDDNLATPDPMSGADLLCDEAEMLDNIEMPTGDLLDTYKPSDADCHKEKQLDVQLMEISADINDFFKEKTPELPTRTYQASTDRARSPVWDVDASWLQGEGASEGATKGLLQASGPDDDLEALISFTP